MSASRNVIELLDQAAEAFDFPILDNLHWRIAAARLRGFRREDGWALVIEILLFHTQAVTFSIEFYGYGPLVSQGASPRSGFLTNVEIVKEILKESLWSESGEWMPGTDARPVWVDGRPLWIGMAGQPDREQALDVLLSDGDQKDEAAFLRGLTREVGLGRMMPDSILLLQVPGLQGAEIVRLTNWDHPDVAGGRLPSDSRALVECARLVTGETTTLQYDHRADNVYWNLWAASPVYE